MVTVTVDDDYDDVENGNHHQHSPGDGGAVPAVPATTTPKLTDNCELQPPQKHRKRKKNHLREQETEEDEVNHRRDAKTMTMNQALLTSAIIVFLGSATSAAFLGIGISSAVLDQQELFHRAALDKINTFEDAFEDYVNAASIVHSRCRTRDFTRQEFRDLYEYLIQSGLRFKAVQCLPNTTHDERSVREEASRTYYAEHYPHVNYRGFVGFNELNSTKLEPRSVQPWYFPIHYMEPVAGNEAAIDLDYHSSEVRIRAVEALFENRAASLSDRLTLVTKAGTVSRCGDHDGPSYGVVLAHPGVNVTGRDDVWPRDMSAIVICIPDLLKRSTAKEQSEGSIVYIHDQSAVDGRPVFMGGADVGGKEEEPITFLEEAALDELSSRWMVQSNVTAANRLWTVSILAKEGTYKPHILFVLLGGVVIFITSIFLSVWVYMNARRTTKFNELNAAAQEERAALVLENAQQQAKTERELNDFLAHEVRNPVAAAMAACNFVTLAVNKPNPLQDDEAKTLAKDDLKIIDNALRFVNDLLRNMLDMHRAASKQLQVNMEPTDLLHDVMEPVAGMLHRRGSKIKLLMKCPKDLVVETDALRLKQVVLNLGRNSAKFVDEGFIRLTAEVVEVDDSDAVIDGALEGVHEGSSMTIKPRHSKPRKTTVRICVDDSGCGIPKEKRKRLFQKFQESLDVLSQGTGIGLFLCKNLVDLMGGEISLDENYRSGMPGRPGTRFVINLKRPPVQQHKFIAVDPDELLMKDNNRLTAGPINNNVATTAGAGGINAAGGVVSSTGGGGVDGGRVSLVSDCGSFGDLSTLPTQDDLPDSLSVLFVDDDAILRKLFSRSIKMAAPGWTVREAANGETAIRLIEEGASFDIIFMDMYMASVEKQLLGTESVAELRARGVQCRICGLSANDMQTAFLEAGADAFMFKPFPCKQDELIDVLCRILYEDNKEGPSIERRESLY